MRSLFFPSSTPIFIDRSEVIEKLKEIALEISKQNTNIAAIYLFGSYADDNAGLHSDADILVVLSRDSRKMMDRLDEFLLAFSDAPVAVDVLVYTTDELRAAIAQNNHLLSRAAAGIKLL